MAGDPRVLGLLEEMLDAGRTPEEVCRLRNLSAAAARFYGAGFAAEPKLAQDVPGGVRHNAAPAGAVRPANGSARTSPGGARHSTGATRRP
jgi:hypothetical protein